MKTFAFLLLTLFLLLIPYVEFAISQPPPPSLIPAQEAPLGGLIWMLIGGSLYGLKQLKKKTPK